MNSTEVICKWAILLLLARSVSGHCFSQNDNKRHTCRTMDGKRLSPGSTDFALALFKSVLNQNSSPEDNVVLSSFSVWSVLLLTYMGARGQTKSQMEKGLGLGFTHQKHINDLYQDLMAQVLHDANEETNYTFQTTNRIYLQWNIKVRDCIMDHFRRDIQKVNFKKEPERSRRIINRWVKDHTYQKIRELIPRGDIDPNRTVMVLVNGAHFMGYWANQFNEVATKEGHFFINSNLNTTVDMMVQESLFGLMKDPSLGFSAIEVPYSGREVSMVILLPDVGIDAQKLAPKLNTELLRSVFDTMNTTRVNLFLPKFKIERATELKEHVRATGIKDLFDQNKTDLSGFNGMKLLTVELIRHQTIIEINEGGTEPANAISVEEETLMGDLETFVVDRPFIFVIRNNQTNTILFIGLIKSPTT